MSYRRVLPRDLFNESKLLKGLGKIALMIHNGTLPIVMNHEDERSGFQIDQNPSDGSISVTNLHFFDNNGTPIYFYHRLNDKSDWTLMMEFKNETYYAFFDDGRFGPSITIFNK